MAADMTNYLGGSWFNHAALTKSLASERSRYITCALISDPNLSPNPNPNQTLTNNNNPTSNPDPTEKWSLFSFSAITPQGCNFTLHLVGHDSESLDSLALFASIRYCTAG